MYLPRRLAPFLDSACRAVAFLQARYDGEGVLCRDRNGMTYSSLAIANEFIERGQDERRPLTPMQVQKLVYLAEGWNLAVNGQRLVEDDIEAWKFGPVIRRLYDALRGYGDGRVRRLIRWGDDSPFPAEDARDAHVDLTAKERAVIDKVWDTYKGYEAFQLSALTHERGSPWEKAYEPGRNRVIKRDDIWDYFADLAVKRGSA